ncbi:uncharacterized protein [Dermacentor andersoni]|uniref:uncharacterized protein n=1 Tax=Dermacentor andersoni TaxID=34620 RepID=UPI003B3AF18D
MSTVGRSWGSWFDQSRDGQPGQAAFSSRRGRLGCSSGLVSWFPPCRPGPAWEAARWPTLPAAPARGLVTPHAVDLVASCSSYLRPGVSVPRLRARYQQFQCAVILLATLWTWWSALPTAWCLAARFADLVTYRSCEVISCCPPCRSGGQLFREVNISCSMLMSSHM